MSEKKYMIKCEPNGTFDDGIVYVLECPICGRVKRLEVGEIIKIKSLACDCGTKIIFDRKSK